MNNTTITGSLQSIQVDDLAKAIGLVVRPPKSERATPGEILFAGLGDRIIIATHDDELHYQVITCPAKLQGRPVAIDYFETIFSSATASLFEEFVRGVEQQLSLSGEPGAYAIARIGKSSLKFPQSMTGQFQTTARLRVFINNYFNSVENMNQHEQSNTSNPKEISPVPSPEIGSANPPLAQATCGGEFVDGVGEVEKIATVEIAVGSYIYFERIIYRVESIESVAFINSDADYIFKLTTLLDRTTTHSILLQASQTLPSWQTKEVSSPVERSDTDKPQGTLMSRPIDHVESRSSIAGGSAEFERERGRSNLANLEAFDNVKGIGELAKRDIPKPSNPPKSDRGVKGQRRIELLELMANGCTITEMMARFNWSQKTAKNNLRYVKNWGYEVIETDGKYQLESAKIS